MKANELKALGEALLRAQQAALECANVNDGGSCNFDHPIIKINRLTKKQAEQLPLRVYKCHGGGGWWGVGCALYGQAMRRTAMAEAFARKMNELGYTCSVYYMMD